MESARRSYSSCLATDGPTDLILGSNRAKHSGQRRREDRGDVGPAVAT